MLKDSQSILSPNLSPNLFPAKAPPKTDNTPVMLPTRKKQEVKFADMLEAPVKREP